jgi:hypothetical protein
MKRARSCLAVVARPEALRRAWTGRRAELRRPIQRLSVPPCVIVWPFLCLAARKDFYAPESLSLSQSYQGVAWSSKSAIHLHKYSPLPSTLTAHSGPLGKKKSHLKSQTNIRFWPRTVLTSSPRNCARSLKTEKEAIGFWLSAIRPKRSRCAHALTTSFLAIPCTGRIREPPILERGHVANTQ